MPEQWIETGIALGIVKDTHAICSRLHAGLLLARAACLQMGDQKEHNTVIGKKFWWAGGAAALTQNWQTGDFSTWVDGKQFHAFGVRLALFQLLEMVAFEKRGKIALGLSVASNGDWMSAKDALAFVYQNLGLSDPRPAIIEQGRMGFLTARAVMHLKGNPQVTPWESEEREWDIPAWFWQNFTRPAASSQDWATGTFFGKGRAPNELSYLTLRGVHFHRECLAAMVPPIQEEAPRTRPGRRAGYDWNRAIDEVWSSIYHGRLTPKTQAEIEVAMIKILRKGDKEPSESAVRPYARRVWAAMETEA